MTSAPRPTDISLPTVGKGLNYMEKPHRYTPGPGGNCLFCSHTQRWHTENRPKTPAEVEQEKKDRAIQEKNEDAHAAALMLTPLPTEQDALQAILSEQKLHSQAEQVAGAPLQDPNDPATAAGVTDPKAKALLKKALAKSLAERMVKAAEDEKAGKKPSAKDAPLINIQYDENKKAGGISEAERKKLADEGIAMEDGCFPIRDESDLKAALKLWGKATDPHEAREHIIVRAVELGLEDSLPQNFKDHQERSKGDKGTDDESHPSDGEVKKAAYAITKAADEKRYTLGPMYIPNKLDAHREFTTAEELQKAVWDYTRAGDRQIRLQHNTSIVAGECVEVLSWPHEITVPLALPTGTMQKSEAVTFPAGTTFMGVVWEPWAWEMVKKGKITGFSMGGWAKRTAVTVEGLDLPAPEDDPKILKFNPNQPRDKYGRWTDGSVSFKPGNWFDRHVMGVEVVESDHDPATESPSREAGNAAANIIGDRKKWTGPYQDGKWTPFDPDKVWHDLPKREKGAVGRLLEKLGMEWSALIEAVNAREEIDLDGSKARARADAARIANRDRFKTMGEKWAERDRERAARDLSKSSTWGDLLPHVEEILKRRNDNWKTQPRDKWGRWTDDIVEAYNHNAMQIRTVNPKSHANRYPKQDSDGVVSLTISDSGSVGKVTEAEVNAYIERWSAPRADEFTFDVDAAADKVLAGAVHNEPFATAALSRLADQVGGEMVGLNHKFKGKGSLMRKIRDKAASKGIAPDQYRVADALRYTMRLRTNTYMEDARNVLRGLRDSGYTIESIENTWAKGDAYSGLHATVVAPDGFAFELQFHTKASLANKEVIHKDYDVWRDPTTPSHIKKYLGARMSKTWQGVQQPPGWKSFGELIAF